jgi:serine/threonine-protein kinase
LPTGELDARADVFALGAVLFELLALAPLVQASGEPQAFYRATLAGPDARASLRAPGREIPPELDAICVRATALDPAQRFGSARELSEAIERFLDGDRDLALRRSMAANHLSRVHELLTRVPLGIEDRSRALSEVGRALVLDPDNPGALQAFVRLSETPMPRLPDEVAAELTARENQVLLVARRSGTWAYAAFVLMLPVLAWMGVRNWLVVSTMVAFAVVALVAALIARAGKGYAVLFYVTLAASTIAMGLTSRMFGPFVLTPSIVAVNVLGLCLIRPRRVAPWPLVASIGACAVLVPAWLEAMGWSRPAYAFADGALQVLPNLVDLRQAPTLIVLFLVSLMLIAFPAALFGQTRSALDAAELELRVRAWHLRQLAPGRHET